MLISVRRVLKVRYRSLAVLSLSIRTVLPLVALQNHQQVRNLRLLRLLISSSDAMTVEDLKLATAAQLVKCRWSEHDRDNSFLQNHEGKVKIS